MSLCSGVFAINIATFIGYKLNKTRGALAIWALGVSPIYIIIIAGFAGYIYGKFVK